jgi:hypothetical protein
MATVENDRWSVFDKKTPGNAGRFLFQSVELRPAWLPYRPTIGTYR